MKLNLKSILKSTDIKKLRQKIESAQAGFNRTMALKTQKQNALDEILTDIGSTKAETSAAIQNGSDDVEYLFHRENELAVKAELHKRILGELDQTVLKFQGELSQAQSDFKKSIAAELQRLRLEYSRALSLEIGQTIRSGLREWRENFEDFKNSNQDIFTPELKAFMRTNLQLPREVLYSKPLGINDADFGPPETVSA
jgi:phage shock protein A